MPFPKPELPFATDALSSKGISKETVEYHYGKHHLGYWRKLNAATEGNSRYSGKSLQDLVKNEPIGKILNLSAQIWNHSFYWAGMNTDITQDGSKGPAPYTTISGYIRRDYGDFPAFMKAFTAIAASHFGSGWVWLCYDQKSDKLIIREGHDAYNPIREVGIIPLMCIDIWEHAYYVDQRNNRGAYIQVWWKCLDWGFVDSNLCAAKRQSKL